MSEGSTEAACAHLMMGYAALQDAGDADAFAALYAEDAVWTRVDGGQTVGRAAILAAQKKAFADRAASGRVVRHHMTTVHVRPVSATEANGTAYALVFRGQVEDGKPRVAPTVAIVAQYEATYVKRDRWLIATMKSLLLAS